MGFLNTKVFIVEKFSFSSKYFFEFLKKTKFVSLSKLDSGNSVLETLASKLDTGFLKSFRIKIQVWYLWPVLYVELLIPKYWRCSCCLYAVISLNFMWNKWIFALQEWSFIKQWCRIIVLRYKKNCAELQILSFECAIARSDLLPGGITKSSLQGKLAILPTHALFDQVKIVSASPLFLPLHRICVLFLSRKPV